MLTTVCLAAWAEDQALAGALDGAGALAVLAVFVTFAGELLVPLPELRQRR
jgi:hypothetical protein